MAIQLKKTKQKLNNKRCFGFDIETENDNKDFTLCSIYSDEYKKTYFSKKEFINDLKTNPIFENSYIFATNLMFDFFGVFFNQEDSENFNTLFRGTSLLLAKTHIRDGEFTAQSRDKSRNMYSSITFLDSMNYAQISVKNMGKIIGINKFETPDFIGEKPKNEKELNQLIEYNLRDSEVTYKFMNFLIEAFEKLGATFKITIASTSMSLFKNKYLKETYYIHKEEYLLDIFKAYYGGRTEAFKKGYFQEANYYDFNSLYPSVMKDYEFPNPNTLRITRKNTNKYIINYEGVSDVELEIPKTKIPVLPYRDSKGKVLFPYGRIKGWYSHIEIRKAIQEGAILIKVNKTYYYKETCKPFRDFVDDLYTKRLEYKAQNNEMQLVTKLLMNSLYGKFGEKFQDKENTYHQGVVTKAMLDRATSINRVGDFFTLKEDVKPSNHCIPIWAVYISAYGRLKLYDVLKEHNPIYCDTDSIITKDTLNHSKKLGELDLEIKIKEGIVVRPKFYALVDENKDYVKIKGLGRRLNYYEFVGLVNIPDYFNNVKFTKSIEYTKFCKFKEAIRRDFIPNEIIQTAKVFSLEDEKRKWNQEFNPKIMVESEALKI